MEESRPLFYTILQLLGVLLLINKSLSLDCSTYECPEYKPFCTDLGCAFRCPDSDYINGTMCVISCNDMFVTKGKVCQKECSSDKFIKEAFIRIGLNIYKEKNCIDVCEYYIHNRSCVPSCPNEAKYVDGNRCVERCPEDRHIVNVALTNKDLKCSQECVYPKIYEDKFCVERCSKNDFVFDGTCVDKCPTDAKLIYVIPFLRRKVCVKQCRPDYFISNSTCVQQCPSFEFEFNKTCVAACPPLANYIFRDNSCVSSCPDGLFILENKCVQSCPIGMFLLNDSCVYQCPVTQPVVLHLQKYVIYDAYRRRHYPRYETYHKCHPICPQGYTCSCAVAWHVFHNTCVEKCPNSAMLLGYKNGVSGCVSQCDNNLFIYNLTCVRKCPAGNEYVYNQACLERCPTAYKYTELKSSGIIKCLQNCPGHTFLVNETECVGSCPPSKKYVYNNTCIDKCPIKDLYGNKPEHALLMNPEHFICLDSCPKGKFIYNGTCLSACPQTAIYAFNDVCTDAPCSTRLEYEDTGAIICADKCHGENDLRKGKSCIHRDECNLPNLIFEHDCLDRCPVGYIWDIYYNDNHCYSCHVYAEIIACLSVLLVAFIIWKREATKNFLILTRLVILLTLKGNKFDISKYDTDIQESLCDDECIPLQEFNNSDMDA